jgi:hypothetical protein
VLGDADLAPLAVRPECDPGVVRHVLGLERRDVDAPIGEVATQLAQGGYGSAERQYIERIVELREYKGHGYEYWAQAEQLGLLGEELANGTVTDDHFWQLENNDSDRLLNGMEAEFGTDPEAADTSGDGYADHLKWGPMADLGLDVNPAEVGIYGELDTAADASNPDGGCAGQDAVDGTCATEAGGEVVVRIEPLTRATEVTTEDSSFTHVRIEVEDTGEGMSESFQQDMFKAFRQESERPRSGHEGGVCELGATNARISALRVRALEMYGFTFQTSRYEGLETHIASAGDAAGHLPITAGAAEPLPALVARLASDITAAMRPEADDAERERLFGEAVQALALPLREDPTRLHLELAESVTDRWLLLESPEPIDLVVETRARLRRRVATRPIDRALEERLRDALAEFFRPRIVIPPRPIRPALDRPLAIRRDVVRPLPRDTAVLGDLARDLLAASSQISTSLPIRDADAFLSVELIRNRFLITLLKTKETVTRPATGLSRAEARALTGILLFFDRAGLLVDWRFNDNAREWQEIGTVAIQSGDATKALLLPRSTGALPAGDYRIDFDINRKWFDTLAPLGPDNAYLRTASLSFLIS